MSLARRGVAIALRHPRHVLLAALVTGLLCAPAPSAAVALAAAAVAVALAAAGGTRAKRDLGDRAHAVRRPRPFGGLVLVAGGFALAGAMVGAARLAALDRTALAPYLGRTTKVRVILLERPRPPRARGREARRAWRPGTGGAALAEVVAGPGRGERVVVRSTAWPRVRIGAEVVAAGRLLPLGRYDGWQRRRGAHARLLADRVEPTGWARGGLPGAIDRLRVGAERAVTAGLDGPRAALARGMVLGEDEALSERTRDDFRASGLAHLVAASGQNVALLAALAIPALAALGLGLRGRLIGALALVAIYVPLAGAGPSIQRAGIMGGAGLVAALAGRPASRLYALLLAAAATLALNPRASSDPGWQLSFAAVAAIAGLAPLLSARLVARRVPRPVADAAAMTAAATLATAPLLAAHFGRVSLVSLPANLLAVPAVAPVMWLGMLAMAAGALTPAAAILVNALAQYPLAFVGWVAAAAAGVPFASVHASPLAVVAGAAITTTALAGWGKAWRRGRGRRLGRGPVLALLAAAALGLATGLPGCGGGSAPPDPADLVVSFLDVGQGDATLIQHGGATVLVDTGPPGGPLLRRLREAGVRRLDLLVVTHAQSDHEGEAADVLDRYPVGLLLDGGDGASGPARAAILAAATRRGVRRVAPDAGQVVRAGPIALDVLWPRREPPSAHAGEDPNRRAIVAHLHDGEFDLLLPADAESDVTAALPLPPVEALKVAHHGSADPGTAGLLARLRPRVAVVEVGRHNPYGHPTAETLATLRAAVPAVYRTDRAGTVRLIVHRGRMAVRTAG